jgi:hypothetical protein
MSDIKRVKIADIDVSRPPRHESLPVDLVERIKNFKEILREVETMSIEQTLYNFRCDRNPENEVAIWEGIAAKYNEYLLAHPQIDLNQKKEIYKQFLVESSEENPITVVRKEDLV